MPFELEPRHPAGADDGKAGWDAQPETPMVIDWYNRLKRRKGLIIGITLFGLVASTAFVFLVTPRYTAEAVLDFDTRQTQWTGMATPVGNLPTDWNAVWGVTWAEVERIRSWPIMLQVADQLSLANDPEFAPVQRSEPNSIAAWWAELDLERRMAALLQDKETALGRSMAKLLRNRETTDAVLSAPDADKTRLVEALQDRMEVHADRNTGLIHVAVTSKNPAKSAKIVNRWIDIYLKDQVARKYREVEQAIAWLEDHLRDLRIKVTESEATVEAYRADAKLQVLSTLDGSTVASQRVSNFNNQLTSAMAELADVNARLKLAKQASADLAVIETSPDVMASPVIQRLRLSDAEISARISELGENMGFAHPKLRSVKAQRAALRREIGQEINRIVDRLQNEQITVKNKLKTITRRFGDARAGMEKQTKAEVRLHELQREAAANRDVYNSFLIRMKELTTQLDVQRPDTVVISPASVPIKASFPNKPIIILAGTLCSFTVAVVLAMLMESIDIGFRTLDQLEKRFGLRTVGIIPAIRQSTRQIMTGDLHRSGAMAQSRAIFLEMLHGIRSNLSGLGGQEKLPRVLLVTSAIPREGKTTTAIALARLSAMAGCRTLLIDCDFARPTLHNHFNVISDRGIADLLEGRAKLADAVVVDPVSKMDVLFAGSGHQHPAELLANGRMRNVLELAKERYDSIIIDSPPLLAVADGSLLARIADQVLLVVQWRRTPRRVVAAALKLLRTPDAKLPVCALTGVNIGKYTRYDSNELRYCLGYMRSYRTSA